MDYGKIIHATLIAGTKDYNLDFNAEMHIFLKNMHKFESSREHNDYLI